VVVVVLQATEIDHLGIKPRPYLCSVSILPEREPEAPQLSQTRHVPMTLIPGEIVLSCQAGVAFCGWTGFLLIWNKMDWL
jgi:hypothetical protein